MHIRLLQPSDLTMLARHRLRHSRENGRDGDFIFGPCEEEDRIKNKDLKKVSEALLKSVTTVGWQRIWILTDETEVLGEIKLLNHPHLKASLHRCLLMMGIERSMRSQGWGSKLIIEAVRWAKEQPSLEWITLYVFENNPPAKALYKKFGFVPVGTTKDLFRVFGQSIDDTQMDLKL